GTMEGIRNEIGNATSVTTVSILNNDFNNFTNTGASPTGPVTFIVNAAPTLNQNINFNTFTNITLNTTGSATFISNSVAVQPGGAKNVSGNSIVTAFNKTGAGGTVTLYSDNGLSAATATVTNSSNNFSNITVTGATSIAGWSNTDGGQAAKNIS